MIGDDIVSDVGGAQVLFLVKGTGDIISSDPSLKGLHARLSRKCRLNNCTVYVRSGRYRPLTLVPPYHFANQFFLMFCVNCEPRNQV